MATINLEKIHKPSKEEQKLAMESYHALASVLDQLHEDNPEIEIEETKDKIRVPLEAFSQNIGSNEQRKIGFNCTCCY